MAVPVDTGTLQRTVPRVLAGGLAVNRLAFGLNYALRPAAAEQSWIGRVARKPPAQVMIRSQGARDVALGAGALVALARGDDREAGRWMAGNALADATDVLATWLARDALPDRGRRLALRLAAASTAIALAAAAGLRDDRSASP